MFNWLQMLDRHLPVRYSVWLLCGVGAIVGAITWVHYEIGRAHV